MNFDVGISVSERGRKSPRYTLETDLNGEVTLLELLRFTRQSLVIISDQTFKEELVKGFDPKPIIYVDGRKNVPLDQVQPFGKIQFFAHQRGLEILPKIYADLVYRSPVKTGRYAASHIVFLDGKQVAKGYSQVVAFSKSNPKLKETSIIRIVNIQPYARKLERYGITAQRRGHRTVKSRDKQKRRGERILAPNGAYYLTVKEYQRRYKNSIKFGFISGSQIGLTATFKTPSSGNRKKARNPSTYLYPCVTMILDNQGKAF